MKAGWEVKALGEVATITKRQGGTRPLPYVGLEDVSSGGTGKFLGSMEPQSDKSTTFEFEPRHLLYGRLRPYLNKVLLPDFAGHCSSEIFPILPSPELDQRFLFYWITKQTTVDAINETCTGARMPRANVADIFNFEIPFPPLDEQKRIVEVLDAAFEGLSRARAHTETNLQNARELFESYRDALFGNSHNGWTEAPLSEFIANITYGFTNPMPDAPTGPLKITAKNVNNGRIDYEGARSTTQIAFDTLLTEKSRPRIGDVLLTKDGTLGRTAVVDVEGLCVNQSVAVITPKPNILPIFMHELLSCRINQTAMIEDAGGTTIKHLYITRVPKIPVFVPKIEEQIKALETLATFQKEARELISHYRAKLSDLDALRQALLQKAFAGELT